MLNVGPRNWITSKAAQPRLTHGCDDKWAVLRLAYRGNTKTTPSASVAAVAIEFPPDQVGQQEALSGPSSLGGPQFERLGARRGREAPHLVAPAAIRQVEGLHRSQRHRHRDRTCTRWKTQRWATDDVLRPPANRRWRSQQRIFAPLPRVRPNIRRRASFGLRSTQR